MSDTFKESKITINTASKDPIEVTFNEKEVFKVNFTNIDKTTKIEIAADTALNDLTDLELSGVDDLHILKYNKASDKWVNELFSTFISDYVEGTQIIMSGGKITLDQSKIDHDLLLNFNQEEHRIINDSGTSLTELWSASKTSAQLALKASSTHSHTESDISDLDRYTQGQVDVLLAAKAILTHTHTESDVTDLDKYTQGEITSLLSLKAALSHEHVESDVTDLDKYTQDQVDVLLAAKALLVHTHNDLYYSETELDNGVLDALYYTKTQLLTSGVLDARYYTESEVDSLIADFALSTHTHDDRYYTESEVDALVALRALLSHTHDDRYYTESELDILFNAKSNINHDHDGVYYTETELDILLAAKATLTHTHDDRYFTENQIEDLFTNHLNDYAHTDIHSHVNKALLDTYLQTEADLSDAVSKAHSQDNDGGTDQNDWYLGDGTTDSNKNIYADTSVLPNRPALRYNISTSKWQYSNDGTTFSNIGSGGAGGAGVWGEITGTLSAQTDLQAELDLKVNTADLNYYTSSDFNIDFATKLISELSDITSAGADIEDAVTKKHSQNTDTIILTSSGEQLAEYSTETTPTLYYSDYRVGQTFTPSVSGTLTKISIWLYKTGTVSNVSCYVYAVDGSKHPTGSPLATEVLTHANMISSSDGVETFIEFSSPASLTAGTEYAIVFDDGFNITYYFSSIEYVGGAYLYSADGIVWDAELANTLYFKTYITSSNATVLNNSTIKSNILVDNGFKIDGRDISVDGANIDLNTTHRSSDGSDHTFVDQDVTIASLPTFAGLNLTDGVDLNNHEIINVDYIDFNLSTTAALAEGRMYWNVTDNTLNLGMPGGSVNLQIGQEGLKRCRNTTGSTILNGSLVYTTGSSGQKPLIALCDNTDIDKTHLLGMATEDIASGSNGYVAIWGKVRGSVAEPINTLAYAVGTKLYMSTAGGWTDTHPTTATHAVIIIGEVQNQHTSEGEIELLSSRYFTIGNDFDGNLRQSIINKNTGTSATSLFTAVNDASHRVSVGIIGSNHSVFPAEAAAFYNEGHGHFIFANDGNKDFVWYTDPTDSHNYSFLSYERMRLSANGDLNLQSGDFTTTGDITGGNLNIANWDTAYSHSQIVTGNPHLVIASEVEMSENGTATYDDVQDWANNTQSSGKISGGTFTLTNGDGTVHVTAGTGFIRATNSDIAEVKFFDWVADTSLSLDDNKTNYIYVDNSGVLHSTLAKTDANNRSKILLGKVYREGTVLHEVEAGMVITEPAKKILTYLNAVNGEIVRATGLITTEIGDLNIAISEGTGFAGLTPVSWSAIDTTDVATTFAYWYKDSTGWQSSDVSVINATQRNDYEAVTGLVDLLNNNHYGCHFVYMHFDGDVHVVYGIGTYSTLAEAELAPTPANLPDMVNDFSLYIGKIIVKKTETSSFTDVRYPWTNVTTTGLTSAHNSLSGLQGGSADEYYHLTSAEHTELTAWLDDVTLGASGALTLPTGQNFTIGSTQWNSGDSIDADSIVDGSTNAVMTLTQETNFETAYTHSQDNSQAHSDYLINNGDDSTTGNLIVKNFTIGLGTAGIDYTLTFDGETNDGVITWKEDEDYFLFADSIFLQKDAIDLKIGHLTNTSYSGIPFYEDTTYLGGLTAWGTNHAAGSPYLGSVNLRACYNNTGNIIMTTRVSSTDYVRLLIENDGDVVISKNLTIGDGTAATDYTLTFDGETNDGILTWMEDEDYFKFSDDILMNSTEKIQLRDSAIHIASLDDGHLDLTADTSVDINALLDCGSNNIKTTGDLTDGTYAVTIAELTQPKYLVGDVSALGGLDNEILSNTVNTNNLILNGGFEHWTAGTAVAPDAWTLGGGGSVAKETTEIYPNFTNSVKLTSDADGNILYNSNASTASFYTQLRGKTITFSCRVHADDASSARIGIYNGSDWEYSSYHTGGGAWELLTVSNTIASDSTEVQIRLTNDGNTKIVYFDGATLNIGAVSFSYQPHTEDYIEGTFISTLVGWTGLESSTFNYVKIGSVVFVEGEFSGTSDSATTTITLPFAASIRQNVQLSYTKNNGTVEVPGHGIVAISSNVLTLYRYTEVAWTASGTKTIGFSIWYKAS